MSGTVMNNRRNQRGDTIVEVLIACAIVGMVIVSSFVVVNRTMNNARQAQEHEEALKLAESQIEALKGMTTSAYSSLFQTNNYQFCVMPNNVGTAVFSNSAYDRAKIDTVYYPDNCKKASLGDYKYNVSIHKTAAHPNTFYVDVDWYGPTGGIDNVGLVYDLYRG